MPQSRKEELEAFVQELGLFREFPSEPPECSLCGSRAQPFFVRCLHRFQLILIYASVRTERLNWRPTARIRGFALALLSLPLAVILESFLNIVPHFLFSMKTLIAFVGIVVSLALPVWLVINRPADYNPLAQVLFSIMLAGFSVWLGVAFASKDASKDAAGRWLPAAEAAVKQLITISATVDRMRYVQRLACDSQEAAPSRRVFETQCRENSEKLATIRDMIDNATATWEIFIANNCEKTQCDDIGRRIEITKKRLSADLARDLPPQAASGL